MSAELSSATAASTAAISSASGGRGTYSLAPALIALTAVSALVPMPQATTGMLMRSLRRLSIMRWVSSATSNMMRSAPWPLRSACIAWSTSSTWATLAPRLRAILPAAVMWPSRDPTMRRRMACSWCSCGVAQFWAALKGSIEVTDLLPGGQHGVEQHLEAARILLPAHRGDAHGVDLADQLLDRRVALQLAGERQEHDVGHQRAVERGQQRDAHRGADALRRIQVAQHLHQPDQGADQAHGGRDLGGAAQDGGGAMAALGEGVRFQGHVALDLVDLQAVDQHAEGALQERRIAHAVEIALQGQHAALARLVGESEDPAGGDAR